MLLCTTASLSLSRALVASSNSIIFGRLIRHRAMQMRCRWPPLSCIDDTLAPTKVS